jgi:hypothetical protein
MLDLVARFPSLNLFSSLFRLPIAEGKPGLVENLTAIALFGEARLSGANDFCSLAFDPEF